MAFWKKPSDQPEQTTGETSVFEAEALAGAVGTHPVEEDLLRRFGRIRSALSPGTIIQGKLSFDSPVRIDGKLTGEIFSSQTLLIGSTGLVSAEVEADIVVVLGNLNGKIAAKSRIEIFPGAKVDAMLEAPILVVHEGALVQGRCEMGVTRSELRDAKQGKNAKKGLD